MSALDWSAVVDRPAGSLVFVLFGDHDEGDPYGGAYPARVMGLQPSFPRVAFCSVLPEYDDEAMAAMDQFGVDSLLAGVCLRLEATGPTRLGSFTPTYDDGLDADIAKLTSCLRGWTGTGK